MKCKVLTALEIDRLKPSPDKGTVTKRDSKGLYIRISADGSWSWVFRYSLGGKAHNMGLGSYPEVSLANARELAGQMRVKLQQTVDPLADRAEAARPQVQGRTHLRQDR